MRFMHMADVHLGLRPDAGKSWSNMRSREIWDTFRSSIQDAAREDVDLLLIAGDLFDSPPTLQALREVDYLFSTLTNTRIVLIAGNHDHLQPGCAYLNYEWSKNVVCLFSTQCECVRFPEIKTAVYGFSYDRQELPDPLSSHIRPSKDDYYSILLLHGGDARHVPFSKGSLEQTGFDYIALGHIHQPQTVIKNKAVYPGCLEALECTDLGERGYILGETHGKSVSVRFVPKTRRRYHMLEVECSEEDTTYSLLDTISDAIGKHGKEDMYSIILIGNRQPGIRYDLDRLTQDAMIVRIEDRTRADMDVEKLRIEYRNTVIEKYIDSFSDSGQGVVEEKALQLGLEALLGTMKR